MKNLFSIFSFLFLLHFSTQAQNLTHAEMLGRPTDNSVTVQAFFDADMEMCIQYGTISGTYPNQTSWQTFLANEPAEILVSGLQANTQYFYRMCYRLPNTTNIINRGEHTFHTQRPAGSTFSFVVQADPHVDVQSDTTLYRLALKNQLEDNPDFMIDLGDFLMSDKLKNTANQLTHDTVTYRCHLLRSYYESVNHSVPLYIALGNHEGEAGWNQNGTANNVAIWGSQDRLKYFTNPFPNSFYTGDTSQSAFVGMRENYYAWEWGDALFVVLDPYWYTMVKPDSLHGWRWSLGKKQYDWLRTTLESSNKEFKFVFAHQIIGGDPDGRGGVEFADLYEWGGNNLDGTPGFATNRPGWYKPIKDLLTENRVNIFFHGHDHFFGKQEKDCLIYQESPQPSHPNFNSVAYATDYGYVQGQILPNSGHIRVTVGANGVQVDYVRAYLPQNENANRHNKDVSATYFIGTTNCYDSVSTGVPMLWNSNYVDELISPNPFSEETKIHFSLDKPEKMTLSIYNENGQLVRHLIVDTVVPAGEFQLIWDGKNYEGVPQANGLYLYSIKRELSGNKSGKIILNN